MPCFHIGLLCGKRLDTIYIIGFEDIWIPHSHVIGYIADLFFSTLDGSHMDRSHVDGSPVFPPDCAIVGIPPCIQRRPPEKWRKGQFSPLLLQGCMQAQPRHSLIAIPRLKIANDMVANELTFYNATSISFSVTKNSGLVAIIATSFLYVEDQ